LAIANRLQSLKSYPLINAKFTKNEKGFVSFKISGHADCGEYDESILCAGVSSAVMLTVNAITEVLSADANVSDKGNEIFLSLNTADRAPQTYIESLLLHLKNLKLDYPNEIKIEEISEC
jgi:Predicted ribosomal protein